MSSVKLRACWERHNGLLDSTFVVKMRDPLIGCNIDNLYTEDKNKGHARNVLSESSSTGLASIEYDIDKGVYYFTRHRIRILNGESPDWRITLNCRLKVLDSWYRPEKPYSNTPPDVWEYVCKVMHGYHKKPIEEVADTYTREEADMWTHENPRTAYFK